jgi:hypothetical protein
MQIAEGLLEMGYRLRGIRVGIPAILPLIACDKGALMQTSEVLRIAVLKVRYGTRQIRVGASAIRPLVSRDKGATDADL